MPKKKGLEQGHKEGHKEGAQKGKLIGKIHATQQFLKRRITPEKKLFEKSLKDLRASLKILEAELSGFKD